MSEDWDNGKWIVEYTYNPDGTVRSLRNGNRTQKEQLYGAARGLTSYRYDCLNQLRSVEYPGRKDGDHHIRYKQK